MLGEAEDAIDIDIDMYGVLGKKTPDDRWSIYKDINCNGSAATSQVLQRDQVMLPTIGTHPFRSSSQKRRLCSFSIFLGMGRGPWASESWSLENLIDWTVIKPW